MALVRLFDFSKAFDKVPHKRLMKKLWNYGVRGKTHSWIQSFLTTRQQRVAVDGENSDWVSVDSGVPQGTVLGPTLFLAFINDLVRTAKHSQVRLFADDCVLYREVKNQEDCELLQADLENLEKWEEKWSMSFNPDKCNSISITRKRNKLCHSYKLHNQDLKQVSSTPYLGVELSSDLTWHDQINKVCSKGNKQLAFLRRNLQINNMKVKETAYTRPVRPAMEYCSTIWDPQHHKYIDQIEKLQRRAARFVCNSYSYRASVTDMLNRLTWEALEVRRRRVRLIMFFKIQHGLISIPLPPFILRSSRPKEELPHLFKVIYSSTEAYRNSFYVRTVREWNLLPVSIGTLGSLPSFKDGLSSFYPPASL